MSYPALSPVSVQACRDLCRKHAKSFYLASWTLPRPKREAAWGVYAYSRISDDLVDRGGPDARQDFHMWRRKTQAALQSGRSDDVILDGFVHVCRIHGIDSALVFQMLDGLESDLSARHYRTFADLEAYCFKVAAIPGLMMLRVLGCTDARAEKPAADLGVAMQLTNILRDLKEDAGCGKVYLPQDELATFCYGASQLKAGVHNAALDRLLSFQIQRARSFYASAETGIALLPNDAQLCVRLCASFYRGILDELERPGFPVLQQRAVVPLWKKAALLGRELARAGMV